MLSLQILKSQFQDGKYCDYSAHVSEKASNKPTLEQMAGNCEKVPTLRRKPTVQMT